MGTLWVWKINGLLMFLLISPISSYSMDEDVETQIDVYKTHNYDRMDEVKRVCSGVFASGSTLEVDGNRAIKIKKELSFVNGDWQQQKSSAPLMPFDNKLPSRSFDYTGYALNSSMSPYKFATFGVTDVKMLRRSKRTLGVNAFLHMAVTLDPPLVVRPDKWGPLFQMWEGHSQLLIHFQGIYTESRKNGGERVLCLLGNTMLPSRNPDLAKPWEWTKEQGSDLYQVPLLQDDQILLVLRYPKVTTLTRRAVLGEMRSLNPKTNPKYFDIVHITSQLSSSAYHFSSEKIVSKACDPYPYADNLVNGGIEIYKGHDFCTMLQKIKVGQAFSVVSNWRCKGTNKFCSKLGPFASDDQIRATNGGFKDVRILLQHVRCEATKVENSTLAKVSFVLRTASSREVQFIESRRSGLGNTTLSAEGLWKSSRGQLCMIGCVGIVDTEGKGCDSRICFYTPLSFSIRQRSILFGSVSSISSENPSYFPLSLEMPLLSTHDLWDRYKFAHPYYNYSKIDHAGAILEKDEPFSFRTVIRESLLTFPKLQESEYYNVSLLLLAEDLAIHVSAVPDPIPSSWPLRTDVQLEVLSLGPMFGREWFEHVNATVYNESPYRTKTEYTEKQLLLNVSAQLILEGNAKRNFSMLFLEGLYDPHVGKMYMIGCRDVRGSWKILHESMDLEAGLDCYIEVVVSYPPTTARWLVNPTAKISISSQRTEDDPLYFQPIKLKTLPILYRSQREDIISRRGVEGILRILTLSVSIACILSQVLYIRNIKDSVSYMSLVMLGIQVIGYSLPLVTGTEAFFKRNNSESISTPSYNLEQNQWIHVMEYTVKLLLLVCVILTLRLFQNVWKSRTRLLTQTSLDPLRMPSDKLVLFITLTLHVVGYISVLIFHYLNTTQIPIRGEKYVDSWGNSYTSRMWVTLMEAYIGLVLDLFLLPQVLGNIIWQIDSKPLRNLYYIGITIVRVLPHVYDYIKDPILNPYFSEEYEFVNPKMDFYSKFGDIALSVLALLLAAIVYTQQKWNYKTLSSVLARGRHRILPFRVRAYERLPTQSFEAELASSVKGNGAVHEEVNDGE